MIKDQLKQEPVQAIKAEGMLLLMTMVWGGTFLFTKYGLADTTPFMYLFIRFSIALVICSLFFWKRLIIMDKRTLKQGLVLGVLFSLGLALQTYGLQLTTITKTAFITGLTVVITPFAFKLIQNKPIMLFSKIGVVVAAIGLYVFTNPDFDNINLGDIFTLISTVFWAVYITYMDIFTKNRTTFNENIQLVTAQFMACVPIVLLGVFIFEYDKVFINWSSSLISSFAYNAIIASFILTLVQTIYQKHTTPVKAALIFSLEPVFTAFFAFLFVNEVLSMRENIGAAILFIGVLTSEIGPIFLTRLNK